MPYIAKTNGGSEVLEVRSGTLNDIASSDQSNWRSVTEIRPSIDNFSTVYTTFSFSVSGDGNTVSMIWDTVDVPLIFLKMRLKDYAANARWIKQQSPLMLPDGTIIDASEDSKAKISQALSVLEKEWATSLDFKAMNGWITVNLAGLTAVAQALVAREQALFTAEKDIGLAIDSGEVTHTSGIDGWAWP